MWQIPVYGTRNPFSSGIAADAIGKVDECSTDAGRREHAFAFNNVCDAAVARDAKIEGVGGAG